MGAGCAGHFGGTEFDSGSAKPGLLPWQDGDERQPKLLPSRHGRYNGCQRVLHEGQVRGERWQVLLRGQGDEGCDERMQEEWLLRGWQELQRGQERENVRLL